MMANKFGSVGIVALVVLGIAAASSDELVPVGLQKHW